MITKTIFMGMNSTFMEMKNEFIYYIVAFSFIYINEFLFMFYINFYFQDI